MQNSAVADLCVSVSDAGLSAGAIVSIIASILGIFVIGGSVYLIRNHEGEYKNNL